MKIKGRTEEGGGKESAYTSFTNKGKWGGKESPVYPYGIEKKDASFAAIWKRKRKGKKGMVRLSRIIIPIFREKEKETSISSRQKKKKEKKRKKSRLTCSGRGKGGGKSPHKRKRGGKSLNAVLPSKEKGKKKEEQNMWDQNLKKKWGWEGKKGTSTIINIEGKKKGDRDQLKSCY